MLRVVRHAIPQIFEVGCSLQNLKFVKVRKGKIFSSTKYEGTFFGCENCNKTLNKSDDSLFCLLATESVLLDFLCDRDQDRILEVLNWLRSLTLHSTIEWKSLKAKMLGPECIIGFVFGEGLFRELDIRVLSFA